MTTFDFTKFGSQVADASLPGAPREKPLPEGDFIVAVNEITANMSRVKQAYFVMKYVVVASSNETVKPGMHFGNSWHPEKSPYPDATFADVKQAMKCASLLSPEEIQDPNVWAQTLEELCSEAQPGRGVRIAVTVRPKTSKSTGKTFMKASYSEIEGQLEQPAIIAATRAWIEAGAAVGTTPPAFTAPETKPKQSILSRLSK